VISSWHIFEGTTIGISQLAHSPIIIIKISALTDKVFLSRNVLSSIKSCHRITES